jgi:hypothetical protein
MATPSSGENANRWGTPARKWGDGKTVPTNQRRLMRLLMKSQLFRDVAAQTPGLLFEVYRTDVKDFLLVKLISEISGELLEEQVVHTSCLSNWLENHEDY